jgi:hypothetical protein
MHSVERALRSGDYGWHRMFTVQSSNFLTRYRSTLISTDVTQGCFRQFYEVPRLNIITYRVRSFAISVQFD